MTRYKGFVRIGDLLTRSFATRPSISVARLVSFCWLADRIRENGADAMKGHDTHGGFVFASAHVVSCVACSLWCLVIAQDLEVFLLRLVCSTESELVEREASRG